MNRPVSRANRLVGQTCRLHYEYPHPDPPDAGDFFVSSGGSVYEVLQVKPSPTIPHRYNVLVARCPRDTNLNREKVYPLFWNRRSR